MNANEVLGIEYAVLILEFGNVALETRAVDRCS